MKLDQLPKEIDLGGGRILKWVVFSEDDVIGATERHPRAKDVEWANGKVDKAGEPCDGMMYFDVPELPPPWKPIAWKVESWDPLTISPSVLCTLCGNHGFIREGKWIPA